MPERKRLIINTTPLLSLIAATGGLGLLTHLYSEVHVPVEVEREILAGQGARKFGQTEFLADHFLTRHSQPRQIAPLLRQSLDLGEAAVIQLAQDLGIPLVAIDEAAGRRIARLSGMQLTGSIGILVKARQTGYDVDIETAMQAMTRHGIWLSLAVMEQARIMARQS